MAIYRTIQLSFWTDEKILDEFTPEDKYFYLYLFTNPQTNLCGCYQLGWTQTTTQMGYTRESITHLIDRFTNVHHALEYSKDTKEVMLMNWHKYNWTTSARFLISLRKEIETVKNDSFKTRLQTLFNQYLSNALSNKDIKEKELEMLKKIEFFEVQGEVNIPYQYGIDTTVTVTDTVIDNNNSNNNSNNKDIDKENIKIIIDYFNQVVGTKYTYRNKANNEHITARLKDGFSIEDLKLVIDDRAKRWKTDPKMKDYLRPTTLFAPSHFENYLNAAMMGNGSAKPKSNWDGLAARLDKETADNLGDLDNIDYGNFN